MSEVAKRFSESLVTNENSIFNNTFQKQVETYSYIKSTVYDGALIP